FERTPGSYAGLLRRARASGSRVGLARRAGRALRGSPFERANQSVHLREPGGVALPLVGDQPFVAQPTRGGEGELAESLGARPRRDPRVELGGSGGLRAVRAEQPRDHLGGRDRELVDLIQAVAKRV